MAQDQQPFSQGQHRKKMYGKRSYRKMLPLHDLHYESSIDDDHGNDNDDFCLRADTIGLSGIRKEDSRRLKTDEAARSIGGLVGLTDKRQGQGQRQRQRQRQRQGQSTSLAEGYSKLVGLGQDNAAITVDAAAEKMQELKLDSHNDDDWDSEQASQKVGEVFQRDLVDVGGGGDVVDEFEGRKMRRRLKKKKEDERDVEGAESRLKSGPLREKDGNINIVPGSDDAGRRRKTRTKKVTIIKSENHKEFPTEVKDIKMMKVKEEENKRSIPLQPKAIVRKISTSPSRSDIQYKTRIRKHRIDIPETQKSIPLHVPTETRAETATTTTRPDQPEMSLPIQSLPTILPSFLPDLVSHTAPLLALATDPSARKAPLPFCTWSDELSTYFDIVKIAEASYGEVYRLVLRQKEAPGGKTSEVKVGNEVAKMATGESVMKVIPLEAPTIEDPGSSMMSSPPPPPPPASSSSHPMPSSAVPAVTSEVQLLRRMATVPGFTNFRDVRIVYGRPGQAFMDAWRDFRNDKLLPKGEDSAFPDPGRIIDDGSGSGKRGRKKMENTERQKRQIETQLWAVIEMEDAGTDLEGFNVVGLGSRVNSSNNTASTCSDGSNWGVFGVWDVFWNVATALAKGEREARFEVCGY